MRREIRLVTWAKGLDADLDLNNIHRSDTSQQVIKNRNNCDSRKNKICFFVHIYHKSALQALLAWTGGWFVFYDHLRRKTIEFGFSGVKEWLKKESKKVCKIEKKQTKRKRCAQQMPVEKQEHTKTLPLFLDEKSKIPKRILDNLITCYKVCKKTGIRLKVVWNRRTKRQVREIKS